MSRKFQKNNFYVIVIDNLGVTALLITASYRNQEFIRIGYFVHNELIEEIENLENREAKEIVGKIKRTIISDKPRVTNFNINWDD